MMKRYSKIHQRLKFRVVNKGKLPVITSTEIFPQMLFVFCCLTVFNVVSKLPCKKNKCDDGTPLGIFIRKQAIDSLSPAGPVVPSIL